MLNHRCCLGIALCMGFCFWGWNRVSAQPASPSGPQTQYVLLDNAHVLTGTVFRQGQSVILRRGNEAELTLRSSQVIAVADDMPSLYQARIRSQHRRSPATVSQRIDDVRWCIDNDMPAHATEALMSVYAVVPDHPIAIQLENRLRRLLEQSPESTQTPVHSVATAGMESPADRGIELQSVSHTELATGDLPTGNLETSHVSSASYTEPRIHASSVPVALHPFTAKVQPILMARCSQCHHAQSGVETSWHLVLPPGGAVRVTQPGSLANFHATVPLCEPDAPMQSRLIQMATTAHGGAAPGKPPIAEYEGSLVETLSQWIATVDDRSQEASEATTPALEETSDFSTKAGSPLPTLNPIHPAHVASSLASPKSNYFSTEVQEAHRTEVSDSVQAPKATEPAADDGSRPRRPARLPTVANPNDVQHFNRETRLRRLLRSGTPPDSQGQ
ncbi:hypothetical protein [Allorhodopirellula solitaria]|nr:hypothetical protein [Allorhodopirellula solitaria]